VIWAEPPRVVDVEECYFYHTMDIPDHGLVHGEWDLRGREAAYLGHVPLAGKRVLEVGTASGHLCFAMERMGASVVAYDLSPEHDWDIVPYAGADVERHRAERKAHIATINNAYWFAHRAFRSAARVSYGTVYEIPPDIGQFDVATLGSVLLHLRDPFLALQRVAQHVQEAVVVTDVWGRRGRASSVVGRLTGGPVAAFVPSAARRGPFDSWWRLPPAVVAEFLKILGFPRVAVTYGRFLYGQRETTLYTVVGQRAP